MGNVVDYASAESLDTGTQYLTLAELDRWEELLTAITDNGLR